MSSLEHHHALVTGGGTGLGFGCAQHLMADGATVTIAGRRADVLEKAAEQLRSVAPKGAVRIAVCDVTDYDQVSAAVDVARSDDGGLDSAVINAGSGSGGAVLTLSPDDLRSTLELNLVAAFSTLQLSARVMKEGGRGGSIIAMSSIAGALGGRFRTAYAVSKAGLDMMVRTAADELGPFGIRVNSVRPGLVPSEATARLTDADGDSNPLAVTRNDYIAQMPLARLGTPDDVGQLVRFLAGAEASWITGQNIAVDGGHTVRRAPNMEASVRAQLGDDVVDELVGPRWASARIPD